MNQIRTDSRKIPTGSHLYPLKQPPLPAAVSILCVPCRLHAFVALEAIAALGAGLVGHASGYQIQISTHLGKLFPPESIK